MVLAIDWNVRRRRRSRRARERLAMAVELGILVKVLWELVMIGERVEYLLYGVRGQISALGL